MDIIVVCYNLELRMLQLQSRSIDKMVDPSMIDNYFIIINEKNAEQCISFIEKVIKPELIWLYERIKIITLESFGSDYSNKWGWLVQQALKLLISRMITNKYYLILDAKNHFIRPLLKEDIFEGELPKARVFVKHSGTRHRELLENSLKYFELDTELANSKTGATTTPYIMYTDITRELLDYIELKTGDIIKLFDVEKPKMCTEFFLYYSFILKKYNYYESFYSCTLPAQSTLFTIHPQTDQELDEIISSAEKGINFIFSVHRKRYPKLDTMTSKRILALWKKSGLIYEGEDEVFIKNIID